MASNPDQHVTVLVRVAMVAAAVMLAHQVAAKAARDALFLDSFAPTDLPKMIAAAAVVAIVGALLFSNLLIRSGPARLLPATLMGSALLHLAEFLLIGEYRSVVVVVTYLHVISSSSIALSMFWSVANESFSPREAKSYFGRIAAAGTVGGVAGGLLAERVAVVASVDALLLVLSILHAVALVVVWWIGRTLSDRKHSRVGAEPQLIPTVQSAVKRAPFLKGLALLVFALTIGTAALDFLFKAAAVESYGAGPDLARFFAFFYTGTQVAAFLVQAAVTPYALKSLGLGRTVMTLPGMLALGGLAALWSPVIAVLTAARAGEGILRGSLFRAGYELFFTPIPPDEKRAVKTAIDVGCDRAGELAAAGVIQLMLLLGLSAATRPLLVLLVVCAAISIWISARMDPAYLTALEEGLLHRAIELDESDVRDSTTLSGLLQSIPRMRPVAKPTTLLSRPAPVSSIASPASDPVVERMRALRGGVASEVRKVLAPDQSFEALIVPQVIRLLAWDEVTTDARTYLQKHCDLVAGQLTDTLLDPNQDFSVRRRIPRILARATTQRTVDALQDTLVDPRFEIRFQVARALEFLHRADAGLQFDQQRLMETVDRELSVSRTIWEGRQLLEDRDETDSQYAYLDEILKDRAHQSIEHVFSLLALRLPRDPLKVAFRALHGQDRVLRGLGLEYLETALPAATFTLFRQLLGPGPIQKDKRRTEDVLQQLMASQQTILLQLRSPAGDALSLKPPPPPTTPA